MGILKCVQKGFVTAASSMSLVAVLFTFGFIWNLISLFAFPNTDNPSTSESVGMILAGISFIIITIYLQSGSMGYLLDRVKLGRADLRAFTAAGSKFYARFFAVGILVGLFVGVFFLSGSLLIAFLGQNANQAVSIAAFVAGILLALVGLFFVILMFLSPYIVVAEDEKAVAAIKRSMATVKKSFWRVFFLLLLLILIGFGIGVLLGLIFAFTNATGESAVSKGVFAALSSFVNAFLGVVVTSAFLNFYLGLSSKPANTPGTT